MVVMTPRESWTDGRLNEFEKRVDERFDEVDRRFDEVDRRFDEVDRRFENLETKMENGFSALNERIDRLFLALVIALFGVVASLIAG